MQGLIKNHEVIKINFDKLWVISKLFAFDNWRMIHKILKKNFQTNIVINPLYDDNAFINLDQGSLSDLIGMEGKWQTWGNFHLKVENRITSRPLVLKGYGDLA